MASGYHPVPATQAIPAGVSALAERPRQGETRAMFSPKWKSDAQHLVKGARKYLDYKRDLLSDAKIGEIESRRQDLIDALKSGDRAKTEEAGKRLRIECENALREKPQGWLEENVEVLFVAIVIALGLRAYYLQPFRIPTGSMQPTLNGINGTPMAKEQWPSLPQRLWEKAMRGRSYVRLVNDRDRTLAFDREGQPQIANTQRFHFFSRSVMFFQDGTTMWLPAPINPCSEIGLGHSLRKAASQGGRIRAGEVLCEGYIDAGDLILVNKFAYHFRKPDRGEVFVFDTIGIKGIDERSGEQAKGSHYIKRLCGVPGDTLSIDEPHLLVDGKIATEPGIDRVMQAQGEYSINPNGYHLAKPERPSPKGRIFHQFLAKPTDTLPLAKETAQPGLREYAALGDNTGNSLDSRYWGTVKEFNLVGPALFTLWPFTSGHWGPID